MRIDSVNWPTCIRKLTSDPAGLYSIDPDRTCSGVSSSLLSSGPSAIQMTAPCASPNILLRGFQRSRTTPGLVSARIESMLKGEPDVAFDLMNRGVTARAATTAAVAAHF